MHYTEHLQKTLNVRLRKCLAPISLWFNSVQHRVAMRPELWCRNVWVCITVSSKVGFES